MEKCHVCGKTTLLPSRFGNVNVCKPCFIKAGGIMWHHSFDRSEDVEKHRKKAIESATKNAFPQIVIEAIDAFFVEQMSRMNECVCCGSSVQESHKIGKVLLCRKCFGQIDGREWKQSVYIDNSEVEVNRSKLLKIANKKGFPQSVIDGINAHFDAKVEKDLIVGIDGEMDQILKVYDTYAVMINDEDYSKESVREEIKILYEEYYKIYDNEPSKGSIAMGAVRNLITGGVAKAGIGLAKAAVSKGGSKKSKAETMADMLTNYSFPKGKTKIDYSVYDQVQFEPSSSVGLGFILFTNGKNAGKVKTDRIFLYMCSEEKAKKAFDAICTGMEKIKQQKREEQELQAQQLRAKEERNSSGTIADELLKFKQLLDMGAITQEEYEKKKTELLNIK